MTSFNLHTKEGRANYRRAAAYLPDKSLAANIATLIDLCDMREAEASRLERDAEQKGETRHSVDCASMQTRLTLNKPACDCGAAPSSAQALGASERVMPPGHPELQDAAAAAHEGAVHQGPDAGPLTSAAATPAPSAPPLVLTEAQVNDLLMLGDTLDRVPPVVALHTEGLRECPFCGSAAFVIGGAVHCATCPASVSSQYSLKIAVETWNRRAPQTTVGDGWRTIDSAPKDGTKVLIWCERIDPTVGWFDEAHGGAPDDPGHDAGWWSQCGEVQPAFPTLRHPIAAQNQPTHWRPNTAPLSSETVKCPHGNKPDGSCEKCFREAK